MDKNQNKKTKAVSKKESVAADQDDYFGEKNRNNSNSLVIWLLILLTGLTIAVVLYAVYSFIHITRLADLAGVHVTQNFKKAADEILEGKKIGTETGEYANWKTYKNNFFEILYPEDWKLKENGNVSLKKYNTQDPQRFDSLAMAVNLGSFENPGELSLKKVLEKNHRSLGKNPQEIKIAGKVAVRTGKIILKSGLVSDGIYWTLDQKVFYIEGVYYNQETEDLEKTFEKIIGTFKFSASQ